MFFFSKYSLPRKTKTNSKKKKITFLFPTSVLKPELARRVDLGLGLVQVEAKTRSGIDPAKPGRPGTRSTRSNPGETRSIFFYCQSLKDIVFSLLKCQNAEDRVKKNEAKSITIDKHN
jgi:hypothetical protein